MHPHDHHSLTREQAKEMLRQHGLRATRQREDVYLALASTKCHKSADELFAEVREDQPGMSLATVYNTLEALAQAGLCKRLPNPSGASRYDADVSEHAHFVTSEGRVMDVPMDLSEQLYGSIDPEIIKQIETRLGVSIEGISLELRGSEPAE
ncbi:MAG: transcriptional repressor [Phycisphaera sp.]|nr:MAG: transcriptional repressor [Phycisphaera sp.]